MIGLLSKARLIPRYNWDYSLSDLYAAVAGAFGYTGTNGSHFERLFGQKPLFTTSGRASLFAILKGLHLPKGANVGVPLFCCSVVFDAVRQAGFIPKFIDIELDNYTLSADDLKRKKQNIAAVVVVHMFGHPADMDPIREVCYNVPVIEDCAQSLFSSYKGKYTGSLSTASFFSFRSGKYLSAGEGSVVFCEDERLLGSVAEVIKNFELPTITDELVHCFATYAKSALYRRPWYGIIGYPVGRRLDRKLNLSAKSGFNTGQIARCDLQIAESRLETFRLKIAQQRDNALYLLKNISTGELTLPLEKDCCQSNYYQFALRFGSREKRDEMAAHLFAREIDTAKYLDDIVDVAASQYGYNGSCPNSEAAASSVLCIPSHYSLSRDDLSHIADSINAFQSSHST